VLQSVGADWAALADWASGKRDPVQEFSAHAQNVPRELRDLLESCLSRKRSVRVNSPEKLNTLLKQISECDWAQLGHVCDACGFLLVNNASCPCCGRDNPAPAKSSASLRSAGTSGLRKGTTTIRKQGSSATLPETGHSTAIAAGIEGMVVIEAGSFLSGESKIPRTLRAFAIDVHPVTEGDYKKYLAASAGTPRADGPGSRDASLDKFPVTGVTWHEASDYAQFYGKRLPTLYEWEKSARGSDGRKFPYGNTFKPGAGNLRVAKKDDPMLAEIGSFPSGVSPYGIHDMCGNALQWTSSARRAGERLFRAVKGACYLDGSAELSRCCSVQYLPPETAVPYLSFRCVKDLE
jgi:formylglycine-generating enzyme required for sulfatase activity